MTREEAILCLKGMKNYGRDTFTEQTDWQESLDMAIEALEQGSILDKIKAEIEELDGIYAISEDLIYRNKYVGLWDVLQIIDKYKAESEVEE